MRSKETQEELQRARKELELMDRLRREGPAEGSQAR
jgi:hypothetical protein